MNQLLRIQPRTITFSASLSFASEEKLYLRNISQSSVAYKIATPESSIYSARPYAGVILPRTETDVTLTQHIDKLLSHAFDGSHRFVLHVIDLSLIPVANASGTFHGYRTVEELLKAVPQQPVTLMEIAVSGIISNWDAGCDTKMYKSGSAFTPLIIPSDSIANSDLPLSVTSWDQIHPVHIPKAPDIHLKSHEKQKNQLPNKGPVARGTHGVGSTSSTIAPSRQRKTENLVRHAVTIPHRPNNSMKATTAEYTKSTPTLAKSPPIGKGNSHIRVWEENRIKVPTSVTFCVRLDRQAFATLQIRNVSESRFAYKVLTNNRNRYAVRPNMGTIEPHSEVNISLRQEASPVMPHDLNDCQDLFGLQVADIDQLSRDGIIAQYRTYNSAVDIWNAFLPKSAISAHVKSTEIGVQMKKEEGYTNEAKEIS